MITTTTCVGGLLCARHCYKHFITLSHLISVITLCGSAIIISSLRKRRLRPKEVMQRGQGHRASVCWSQNYFNPSLTQSSVRMQAHSPCLTFTHSLTLQTLSLGHALSSGGSEALTVQVKGCIGKAVAAAETRGSGGSGPAGSGMWVPCMGQSSCHPGVTPVRWATSQAWTAVENHAIDSGLHSWICTSGSSPGNQKRPRSPAALGSLVRSRRGPQLCLRGCDRGCGVRQVEEGGKRGLKKGQTL